MENEITGEEIDSVWGNSNFGSAKKIDVVKYGLLKCASGYRQGSTATSILKDLSLITPAYELTLRGKRHLWLFFGNKNPT